MKENAKVSAHEHLIVGTGKSSRLAQLANKVKKQDFKLNQQQKQSVNNLKPEASLALQRANTLIEQKMSAILDSYPAAMKNSLFKLRYGVEIDKISTMAINDVFSLLGLDKAKIRQFTMIENLDSKGVISI